VAVRCNVASPSASTEDAEEVKGRILAAGRDCVPRQRNSIVALQSRTGVEVGFFYFHLHVYRLVCFCAPRE
jgi:hypothetical protein